MKPYLKASETRGSLTERRQYPRYRPAGDEVLVFRRRDKKIGWITDISGGGLSYEYVWTGESKTRSEVLDVFAFGNTRLFLPGLYCKRIYDIDESITPGSCGPIAFSRCGLSCKFSKRQAARWNDLIINCF